MRIVSGIRPSGELTIANYLGAIKQFLSFQKDKNNERFYFIADLHALTTPYSPSKFPKTVLDTLALYLAFGLDPKKSVIFLQSKIHEHTELTWLLATITPVGQLSRMTQYKEKVKEGNPSNAGLLFYPILMASDILLYKGESVPIGDDQKQHLELTQDLAERFNSKFGKTFPIPKAFFLEKNYSRIKSLLNPNKKMAKSNPDEAILILDSPDEIKRKIKKAVTDSGKEIKFDLNSKPAISNLLTIYSGFSDKSIEELEKEFQNKSYSEFKESLIQLLIEKLIPIQKKYNEFIKDQENLINILEKGSLLAQKTAYKTLLEVKQKMGLEL